MAYSFPVFRKGMIFKTNQLVSVVEAKKIASRIKAEYLLYNSAFRSAIAHNNGSIIWEDEDKKEKDEPTQAISQYIKESYILNFPSIAFRYKEFSIKARNSVTVCMHAHQSKIWTRLSCARFGHENATTLDVLDVGRFFRFAAANADGILSALANTYKKHVKEAGVAVPKSDAYFFQLRAFNSTTNTSQRLLNELRQGLPLSEALDHKQFRAELVDYFAITLGKKTALNQIKRSIKDGRLDVFGYKSSKHDAIFTARINEKQTDICGYGHDDESTLGNKVFSHAATKDLLKEYAQQF